MGAASLDAASFEAFSFKAASFEAFSFKAASFENQLPISKQLEDRFPYQFLFTKPSLLHFFDLQRGSPFRLPRH